MKKKEIKAGDFELKKDAIVPILGTSEVYSNSNLTDEVALKILSKNPNAISIFKKRPKNWKEQVDAYVAGQTKVKTLEDVAQLTVKAIKVLFPDATGKNKDELIADIKDKYPALSKNDESQDENPDDESKNVNTENQQNNDPNQETQNPEE